MFSALFPFSFQFYQKFGYGSLGSAFNYTFEPKDIRFINPPSGKFVTFQGNVKQLNDIYNLYNGWVRNFDFGILLKTPSIEKFKQDYEREKAAEIT